MNLKLVVRDNLGIAQLTEYMPGPTECGTNFNVRRDTQTYPTRLRLLAKIPLLDSFLLSLQLIDKSKRIKATQNPPKGSDPNSTLVKHQSPFVKLNASNVTP